jgi:hypothetical protein
MRGLDSFYLDYYEAVNRERLFDKPRDVGTAIAAIMANIDRGNVRMRDAHRTLTTNEASHNGSARINSAQNKGPPEDVTD